MKIGRLKEVELRNLWTHEENDFSSWLVKEENIEYLNEILGLTLVDVIRERRVGSFECDIFAKDESTDTNVIIENQLETSDHDYLGKIITYASGLDANVVVWIVKRAREEHRSAIEWLNNNTTNNLNFFLIEIHAYSIGDSAPAPYFEIIEQPNDFIKSNKSSLNNGTDKSLNKAQLERLNFWTKFNEKLEDMGKPFNLRKPSTDHWYDVTIGSSKSHLTIELINKENLVRIGMYMSNDHDTFDKLFAKRDIIESEIGVKLEWVRECNGSASRIKYNLNGLNFDDHSNYDELMQNIIIIVSKMQKVFRKHI